MGLASLPPALKIIIDVLSVITYIKLIFKIRRSISKNPQRSYFPEPDLWECIIKKCRKIMVIIQCNAKTCIKRSNMIIHLQVKHRLVSAKV
jgi:hypothetical protein